MRMLTVTMIALIGGLVGGLVLSEIIGAIGILLLDRAVGIKFLPLYLAVACAGAAPIMDHMVRRRSR
ncbi:MAG: DUF5957 family protein [Chloroflexota bacterium]|nr:DUF5957 family protein [Chloroflexota bacterium]